MKDSDILANLPAASFEAGSFALLSKNGGWSLSSPKLRGGLSFHEALDALGGAAGAAAGLGRMLEPAAPEEVWRFGGGLRLRASAAGKWSVDPVLLRSPDGRVEAAGGAGSLDRAVEVLSAFGQVLREGALDVSFGEEGIVWEVRLDWDEGECGAVRAAAEPPDWLRVRGRSAEEAAAHARGRACALARTWASLLGLPFPSSAPRPLDLRAAVGKDAAFEEATRPRPRR